MPLMTGHHRRHNRIGAVTKKKIDSGQLGRLVASHSMCWLFKPETYFNVWRKGNSGGSVLINLTHDIDLMRYLIRKIESVHCFGSSIIRAGDAEDSAAVNLKYENGVLSTLSISDTMVGPWSWEQTSKANPPFIPTKKGYVIGLEELMVL